MLSNVLLQSMLLCVIYASVYSLRYIIVTKNICHLNPVYWYHKPSCEPKFPPTRKIQCSKHLLLLTFLSISWLLSGSFISFPLYLSFFLFIHNSIIDLSILCSTFECKRIKLMSQQKRDGCCCGTDHIIFAARHAPTVSSNQATYALSCADCVDRSTYREKRSHTHTVVQRQRLFLH